MQEQSWTKKSGAAKPRFLHTSSCGYAAAFPQARCFSAFFLSARVSPARLTGQAGSRTARSMRLPLAVADSLFCRQAMRADGGIGRQSSAAVSMVSRCLHHGFASSMEKFAQSHSCRRFFLRAWRCLCVLPGRWMRGLFGRERSELFFLPKASKFSILVNLDRKIG